jgi:uncharacterized RDD family membrane protein YckC
MNAQETMMQEEITILAHDPNGDYSVYEPAPIKNRIFANILDAFLLGALCKCAVVLVDVFVVQFIDLLYLIPINILVYFMVVFAYYLFPMTLTGATIGKRLFDVKVVYVHNSEDLTLPTIFMREFTFKTISMVIFMLGYILPFVRQDKRALHDLLAKTRVINLK